ncbi:hypothetical protein C8J57DRAFT_1241144 [Mycena rebaudengoi]|nr:hypothetical protein C8J57DRAFT_1241144 [Mycena rebaudengoi]
MVTLLVCIAIPLEANPGQLELGCENMWPNHADKGMYSTWMYGVKSTDISNIRYLVEHTDFTRDFLKTTRAYGNCDFRDAGFVGHCLGRFLVDLASFDKGQKHEKTVVTATIVATGPN